MVTKQAVLKQRRGTRELKRCDEYVSSEGELDRTVFLCSLTFGLRLGWQSLLGEVWVVVILPAQDLALGFERGILLDRAP